MNESGSDSRSLVPDDGDSSGAAAALSELYEAAMASAAAGDLESAVRLGTELHTARAVALGPYHPDTLAVAALVGSWRLGTGDVSGAVDVVRPLVPIATTVLGADHPSTLTARHTLACCGPALGVTPGEALAVWVQLYGDEQRVFGAGHHSTLSTRHQIGELRRQLGDRIGARDELTAAALGVRQVLGDDHPESLAIQLAAAICVGEAGDTVAALTELDRLIPVLTSVLGYDHHHTLLARHTRALWLPPGDGDLLDRVSDWEVLIDDEVRVLGEQHELTVAGRQTLEEQRRAWQQHLGESEAVAADLSIDLEIDDRLGEVDPQRPWGDSGSLGEDGKANLAETAAEVGSEMADLMAAVVEAKKLVEEAVREFGATSQACLGRRYKLAQTLWRGHQFDSARARTEPLITDCSSFLGEEHPLTEAARALLVDIQERRWPV